MKKKILLVSSFICLVGISHVASAEEDYANEMNTVVTEGEFTIVWRLEG